MSKKFNALIIGDELLSGKRNDKHMHNLISSLHSRGLRLEGVRFVRDNPSIIIEELRKYMNDPKSVLFSFGGIGATPDDHTRQCAAASVDEVCAFHPELRRIILEKFSNKAYPSRINMSFIPKSARLIPNPINGIAGFSVKDAHFFPGFPEMAKPMTDWVLDEYYSEFFKKEDEKEVEYTFIAHTTEGEVTWLMEDFVFNNPSIAFSSLPMIRDSGPCIEFGFTGIDPKTKSASEAFRLELISLKFSCSELLKLR